MVGVVVMLKVIVGVICVSSAFVQLEVAMKNPYGGSCLRANIQCKGSLVRKRW